MIPLATKEEIESLYVEQHLSMHKVASTLGVSVGAIHKYIHHYGIPARKIHDYPISEKAARHIRELGRSRRGSKLSKETKAKISEARKLRGPGAKKRRSDGYISIYYPTHPKATKDGYVMEHIVVMEGLIGRHLERDECVHHINQIRNDNRPENLKLMTKHDHMSYHMKKRHAERRMKSL